MEGCRATGLELEGWRVGGLEGRRAGGGGLEGCKVGETCEWLGLEPRRIRGRGKGWRVGVEVGGLLDSEIV